MIVHASPTVSWVLLVAASDSPRPAPRPTSGATITARSPSISNMMSVAIPSQIPYSDDHSTSRPRPSLPPVTVRFFSSTMSSHIRATVAAQGVFGSAAAARTSSRPSRQLERSTRLSARSAGDGAASGGDGGVAAGDAAGAATVTVGGGIAVGEAGDGAGIGRASAAEGPAGAGAAVTVAGTAETNALRRVLMRP